MITKDEAIAALREQAFEVDGDESTCGHTGCRDHRIKRSIVHCVGRITGADWDVATAVACVERSPRVEWVARWDAHDLAVLDTDGVVWHFDVRKPRADKTRTVPARTEPTRED